MAENSYNVRLKHKKDTHENWTENNPILLNGELAIAVRDGLTMVKVGNGGSRYNDLDFITDWVTKEDIDAMFAGTYVSNVDTTV